MFLGAAGFRVIFFSFFFLERPRPPASMRPPPACRLQGFLLLQCFGQSYLRTFSRNHLLCYCYTRGPPEMFVHLHGMAALLYSSYMLLLSTAAAVIIHTTHMPQAKLRGTRLA